MKGTVSLDPIILRRQPQGGAPDSARQLRLMSGPEAGSLRVLE